MNGLRASLAEAQKICDGAGALSAKVELAICPPATLAGALGLMRETTPVALGGQDCHSSPSGAHTGDISAEMWADIGARYVIVGHSERRADHGETDAIVASKANAVLRAGLIPIICLGESLDERDGGQAVSVVERQLLNSVPDAAGEAEFVVAYEPIWAIGTGRTPTVSQVEEVHNQMRKALVARFGPPQDRTRLLYGGSVKPANAAELMHASNVDGALVGGASLKADDFLAIATAST